MRAPLAQRISNRLLTATNANYESDLAVNVPESTSSSFVAPMLSLESIKYFIVNALF